MALNVSAVGDGIRDALTGLRSRFVKGQPEAPPVRVDPEPGESQGLPNLAVSIRADNATSQMSALQLDYIHPTTIDAKQLTKAHERFKAIQAAIEAGRPYLPNLREAVATSGLSVATLYRLIQRFEETRDARSLCDRGVGQPRKARLDPRVIDVIAAAFHGKYLTNQNLKISRICEDVRATCWRDNLPLPSMNTVRTHLKRLRHQHGLRAVEVARGNRKIAHTLTPHHGTFNQHFGPWSLVQIDHTKLDIMVVDEETRKCVGRAFITIACDVYSRMILGFYISLDPVGALSTGLCLLHAMLPKDEWLKECDVPTIWPCWGKPAALHFDNGREFLGKMIHRFCKLHDVIIDHRPVGSPHFGGHVERMIRTLNEMLHTLPGSSFSNVQKRGDYNSEEMAALTVRELNAIVTEWITGTYHQKLHRTLGRTPLSAYQKAILGSTNLRGVGLAPRQYDENRLRFDLMPVVERTIQPYGVALENLVYVGEALGPYTGEKCRSGKGKLFTFLQDPRRINDLYFVAPDTNEIYALKLRDPLRANMSLWEWRAFHARAIKEGKDDFDQRAVFESHERLEQRRRAGVEETKKARRIRTRRMHHKPLETTVVEETEFVDWQSEVEPLEDRYS
ncbi:MAG TPA: Mu transposase C-terminal domain-containing protein [Candidatus Baltobacteraceae bacterium]|nr:Mu transposase C-terminal domain-containing protein [Candidatus Baltobacteraceae bacterium]